MKMVSEVTLEFEEFPGKSFVEAKRKNIKIVCDGRTFHLHKSVLSVCSQYFSDLFRELVECPKKVINLEEVSSNDFELILKYIYDGEVTVDENELVSLMDSARYLKIKGLCENTNEEELSPNATKRKSISKKQRSVGKVKKKKSMKLQFTRNIGLQPFSDNGINSDSDGSFDGFSDNSDGSCDETPGIKNLIYKQVKVKEEELSDGELADQLPESWSDPTSKEPLQCEVCPFTTMAYSNLNRHNISHISEQIFYCELCSYETTKVAQLHRHSVVHLKGKTFSCSLCSYNAPNADLLRIHVLTHTGLKPYICKVPSCSYKDTNMKSFQQHVLSHKLPHACGKCSFRSMTPEGLFNHIVLHDEKTLKCSVCDYTTQKTANFHRHALIHRKRK